MAYTERLNAIPHAAEKLNLDWSSVQTLQAILSIPPLVDLEVLEAAILSLTTFAILL